MAYVQTDDPRVVRDTSTRALLATDREQLRRHRQQRAAAKQSLDRQAQHEKQVEERFASLNGRLDRCETLLHELVQHLSSLTNKYTPETSERE